MSLLSVFHCNTIHNECKSLLRLLIAFSSATRNCSTMYQAAKQPHKTSVFKDQKTIFWGKCTLHNTRRSPVTVLYYPKSGVCPKRRLRQLLTIPWCQPATAKPTRESPKVCYNRGNFCQSEKVHIFNGTELTSFMVMCCHYRPLYYAVINTVPQFLVAIEKKKKKNQNFFFLFFFSCFKKSTCACVCVAHTNVQHSNWLSTMEG